MANLTEERVVEPPAGRSGTGRWLRWMLYHTTASPYYRRTKAQAWFRTPEDGENAGFKAYARR